MTPGSPQDAPSDELALTSVRRGQLGADPTVDVVAAQHAHLAGGHEHQWNRFTIRSRDFWQAAGLAAALGWWLHCWSWEQADHDVPDVVDSPPPAGESAWIEDPADARHQPGALTLDGSGAVPGGTAGMTPPAG